MVGIESAREPVLERVYLKGKHAIFPQTFAEFYNNPRGRASFQGVSAEYSYFDLVQSLTPHDFPLVP